MQGKELVFEIDRQERQEAWLDACSIEWKLRVYLEPVSALSPVFLGSARPWMR